MQRFQFQSAFRCAAFALLLAGGCSVSLQAQTFDSPEVAERLYLSDDGVGPRAQWEERGVRFDINYTQFLQGITSGGLREEWRYAGHGDYLMNVDLEALDFQDGLSLQVRAEHRVGSTISADTGGLFPPAVAGELPTPTTHDLYLTNFFFTQRLTDSFGLYGGKLDTLDTDANAFASGRGTTQFSNFAFVGNPAMLRTVPYSTLGAGMYKLRNGRPLWTLTVLNAIDTTRTSGFAELFDQGATILFEARFPTCFLGRPGHHLFGGTWSDRNYRSFGPADPRIILPNMPINAARGSWSSYWNCDQYLHVDPNDPTRGWGVFCRFGVCDSSNSVVGYFGSIGVGGCSPFRGRQHDTFGAGWYYTDVGTDVAPQVNPTFGQVTNDRGAEIFYNIAVYRWFHVTADFQFIDPIRSAVSASQICGLRAKLDF